MNGQIQFNRGLNEPRLPRSALAVRLVAVMFLCFLGWAYFFKLDEVTTGTGTVEPSGRDQVVQSLEGGILYHLNVKVGDIVPASPRHARPFLLIMPLNAANSVFQTRQDAHFSCDNGARSPHRRVVLSRSVSASSSQSGANQRAK